MKGTVCHEELEEGLGHGTDADEESEGFWSHAFFYCFMPENLTVTSFLKTLTASDSVEIQLIPVLFTEFSEVSTKMDSLHQCGPKATQALPEDPSCIAVPAPTTEVIMQNIRAYQPASLQTH